jgi:hypothetical protein
MSLMALIAEQQIKNKVGQGYTDLPPDVNGLMDTWNFAETAVSNVPNVTNDAIQGVMALLTDPKARKQLYSGLSDLTLGAVEKLNDGPLFDTEQGREQAPKRIETADQAINAVKEAFSSNRKTRETLSQNPDLLAGGLWGASKAGKLAGKHLGPKLGEKIEQHLMDIGGIKQMAPPKRINRGSMPEAEFEAMKAQVRENWAVGKTRDAAENRRRGSQASMEIRERVRTYEPKVQTPTVGYHKSTAKFDKIDPSKQQISSMGTAHYIETNPAKKDDFPGMFLYEQNLPGDIKMKTINWGDGGQSPFVLNALQKIQKEVKFDLELDDDPILAYSNLIKNLGSEQKAQALLIKHGIKGSRSDTVYGIYDSKIVELTKRNGKKLNKKKPKFEQGLLDFD